MATTARQRAEVPIERLAVAAFTVPTEAPESDGTLEWDSTTVVVVEVEAAGVHGLGYTYADATAAEIVQRWLVKCVAGRDAMDVPAAWVAMRAAVAGHRRCPKVEPGAIPSVRASARSRCGSSTVRPACSTRQPRSSSVTRSGCLW